MRKSEKTKLCLILIFLCCLALPALAAPPKVIKTTPENGEKDVAPSTNKITIYFDQAMATDSYSICEGPDSPKMIGELKWIDNDTAFVRVKLEPNRKYSLSVNCPSYQNFKNLNGESGVIYPISFETGDASSSPERNNSDKSIISKLHKAVYAEETEGDLDKAIGLYEQVIEEAGEAERIAAKAAYKLGGCYLKKGDKEFAALCFQSVVEKYPSQTEYLSLAKEQLEKMGATNSEMMTQEMYNIIDSNGLIRFKQPNKTINNGSEPITTRRFINSDFVKLTKMYDVNNVPIPFETTHEGSIYRYVMNFNKPIMPGESMAYYFEGTVEGLIKPVSDKEGVFRYYMVHSPAAGQPVLRIETYLLPDDAELISKHPDLQQSEKDGRIELHVEKVIPAGGNITTEFQYKLSGKEISSDKIKVYTLDKSVADFGDDDFSTPESAYAAINRVSASGKADGWKKVSVPSLADRMPGKDSSVPEDWAEVLRNAKIVEVRIYDNKYAQVTAELLSEFSTEEIKQPFDIRHLELVDGKWLNAGNDRRNSLEETAELFEKVVQRKTEQQETTKAPISLEDKKQAEDAKIGSDLQEKINSAKSGDTIIVTKGDYSEPITINKSLTLKGQSQAECVFNITSDTPAILINTKGNDKVTIEDVTIKWQLATSEKNEMPCALVVKDSNARIINCKFEASGDYKRSPTALNVTGFSNTVIDSSKFEGFDYVICFGEGTRGKLLNSVITNCQSQGIILYSGATVDVIGNIITGSKKHAVRSTGGTLRMEDNLIVNNANRGVYLGNKSAAGIIKNNVIMASGTGIGGFANSKVTIENNIITDSTYAGIGFKDSCSFQIRNNIFTNNERGWIMFKEGESNNNGCQMNTFWKNKTDVENFEKTANSILENPNFADAANGDFSLRPGTASDNKQGLTNPEILKKLWEKYKNPGTQEGRNKAEEETEKLNAAVKSALDWLEMFDNGSYDQSWDAAASLFKVTVTQSQWQSTAKAVREPLGKLLSREVTAKNYTQQVPGGPDGQYVIITFKSSFENKKDAVETITPMLDNDGKWKVSGYYIK